MLLCAAVYLPGLMVLPAVDRDEARFAQASRQMFESVALPEAERDPEHHSGGLVVPMLQGRARLNKPPLIYWVQSASAAVFTGGQPGRDAVWMYRVPSTLAAVASVLMLWRLGLSMFDPRAGFLAAVMLAVCPVFVWEARQARADHVLTAYTIAAMAGLWGVWRRGSGARGDAAGSGLIGGGGVPRRHQGHRGRRGEERGQEPAGSRRGSGDRRFEIPDLRAVLLMWVGVSLGTLTKGPITPMIVIFAAVALSLLTRRWRWLGRTRPVLGAVVLAAALVPWLLLLTERYGMAQYLALVYDETLGRATTARESHGGPPGYHVVLLIVMMWPGSLVTGMAVVRGWKRTIGGWRPWRWRARPAADGGRGVRSRAAELFCLAWVLPAWVVFELSATKLPHYVMPLFPALALLSARTLLAASAGSVPAAFGRVASMVYVLWLGVSAIGGVGILAASLLLFDGAWVGPVWIVGPLALLAVVVQIVLVVRAGTAILRRKPARAMRSGLAMAVVLWVVVLGVVLPRSPSLWVSRATANALRAIDPRGLRAVGLLFREDSMIFEMRGRAERLPSVDSLDEYLQDHPGALVVMRQDDLRGRGDVRVLAYVSGFNIAGARRERLAIVEAAGGPGGPVVNNGVGAGARAGMGVE